MTKKTNRGMCGNCGEEVDFDTHDRDACRPAVDLDQLTEVRELLPALAVAALRAGVCTRAKEEIRRHRSALRDVGATAAAGYLDRALKSIEGAERHAFRLLNEAREAAQS